MSIFANAQDAQTLMIDAEMSDFSVVVLMYDHLLTLEYEVEYIWTQRWSKSSAIFFLNRYFGLAAHITSLAFTHLPQFDFKICHDTALTHQVFLIVAQLLLREKLVIISMRVYALYGIAGWSLSRQSTVDSSNDDTNTTNNCHLTVDLRSSIRLAISYEVLFAYDATIFALTLFKTWRTRKLIVNTDSTSLIGILLRDGAVYFMLMALGTFSPSFSLRGRLSTFSSCLSITLVSRMMLNLHRAHSVSGVFSTLATPMFEPASQQPSQQLDTLVEVELDDATSRAEAGRMVLAVP
ncbi:hypothetical protein DL96DRAFT_1706268 [Flagelloscypha sp. PMI_526]|nr:hypothetical protein DL96DRAFT_1706268 [Flagelloscypha sp. PMI_526]